MSHFSESLDEILRERALSQAEFARRTRIAQGQISSYINGDVRPTTGGLTTLSKHLGEDGARLWVAYLQDLIPAEFADQVEVTRTLGGARVQESPAAPFPHMSPKLRKTLEAVARECERRPKLIKAIEAVIEITAE